jgi:DNA-binding NtrC family response regulator
LSRLLRAAGFTVQTFESAKSFLSRTDPDRPGCVVADLQMPEMNGIELQEALARTANPLPVVFLTGQGDIPTTVRAMRPPTRRTRQVPRSSAILSISARAPRSRLASITRWRRGPR